MIIKNCHIITWDERGIIKDAYISISNGLIDEIGLAKNLRPQHNNNEVLDAKGHYVLPGMICSHTHFYGAFVRGLSMPVEAPSAFPEILTKLWWKLDRALLLEDVQACAQLCLVDAIKHGTTTLFDHHASPSAIDGSLDVIVEEVLNAGLRASLCYEVTDRNGIDGAKKGIRENVRFIERLKRAPNARLAATFGIHAGLSVSDETLAECRDLCPEEIGFHIHLAEHPVDVFHAIHNYGVKPGVRLNNFGILKNRTILGHCVHIDARELELIRDSGSTISHQPRSNMGNAVDLPDIESYDHFGARVGLGNDGYANSMIDEVRVGALAHKLYRGDPRRVPTDFLMKLLFKKNSKLAQEQFNIAKLGLIEVGAPADLVLVDYKPITEINAGNVPWHMTAGFTDDAITGTIVNGKPLMLDRKVLHLDEEAIAANAYEKSKNVWKRFKDLF